MDHQQQLNEAIAHQIGALIIENHALKLQVAALRAQIAQKPPPTDAGNER